MSENISEKIVGKDDLIIYWIKETSEKWMTSQNSLKKGENNREEIGKEKNESTSSIVGRRKKELKMMMQKSYKKNKVKQ